MTKVCRLCLSRLQRGSKYFNINAVESFTGFMPYRDQLTTCIPEMALDLIPNPVICNNCRTALKSSYDFKSRCLLVEKKIREYAESLPLETTEFDLSVIDTSELPKITRIATAAEVEQAKKDPKAKTNQEKKNEREPESKGSSLLSNLLTLKKEEYIMFNSPGQAGKSPNKCKEPAQNSVDPLSRQTPGGELVQVHGKMLMCNHCNMGFNDVPSLHRHKQNLHAEEFLCNFCNQPFSRLQSLRKHNIQCQKASLSEPNQSSISSMILTKRPHLPMKAKNHLKKWLFKHTDHPYPTDVEKQQLMKETDLSLLQVENWFINARRRILGDLTKLKNMRGRGRQKIQRRPDSFITAAELQLDNSDLNFESQDLEETFDSSEQNFDDVPNSDISFSALKKLNDSLEMNMDTEEENGAVLMSKKSSRKRPAEEEDVEEAGESENGEEEGSENSEDGPEVQTNVKMEIVEEELEAPKSKPRSKVKQEPKNDDNDENSSD